VTRSLRQSNQGRDQPVIIPFGCLGPQKIPAGFGL